MIRDKNHLKFIRSLPCCVCRNPETVAAHIRVGTDGGMGLKPSDCYTVPLCHSCHTRQHRIGERTFWRDVDMAKEFALSLHKITGEYEKAIRLVYSFFGAKLT